MKPSIALLAGLALFVGTDGVLAHGGGRSGGFHSAGHTAVFHGGGGHSGAPRSGGHPVVSVHPAPIVRSRSGFIGHAPFFHRHRFVSRAVVVGAPFFFPYYYPYYYSPAYPAPVYSEPPAYIEQGAGIRYYCPDYQDYYPDVARCPSPWMKVVPDGSAYPR